MTVLSYAVVAIAAYLIGGISIANPLARKIIGKNITEVGSGNAGASNVIRNCGWAAGIATLAFDAGKAVASMYVAKLLIGLILGPEKGEMAFYIAAIAVILGHIWPIYTGFKGGKGVACAAGVMLYLMPIVSVVVIAICALITVVFKTMSITSFTGLVAMVVAAFILYPVKNPDNIPFLMTVCLIFIITVITHLENIKRLIKGEEAKISLNDDDMLNKKKDA